MTKYKTDVGVYIDAGESYKSTVYPGLISHKKSFESIVCPTCGAIYSGGHWIWGDSVEDARKVPCPACLRIKDNSPAGILVVSGDFLLSHQKDILKIIHNVEFRELSNNPLKKIINYDMDDNATLHVFFTDAHMARATGEALYATYKGELDYHYKEGQYLLRVSWIR